jgi:hypothetical protein
MAEEQSLQLAFNTILYSEILIITYCPDPELITERKGTLISGAYRIFYT